MVLELAEIRIPPGTQGEFDAAIAHGLDSVLSKSPGYRAHQVHRGVESPERYVLMVWWDTLEAHTVGFRASPLFAQWRAIVSPFFAEPPRVEHFTAVTASS
jgi:heme-degrading monooxygenase HmoA